ncbi:MAG TPA: LysR substrate-binding domain-containing protein, partial [Caulobacteraceae bacterium]
PGLDRWTLVDADGVEQVVTHEPRLSASDFTILRQAVMEGVGIALLPELSARVGLADGRLERILPNWTGPEGTLHLVFTSRRGLLPGVRAFIDFAAGVLDLRSLAWAPAWDPAI